MAKSLEALMLEACEVARDCQLTDGELRKYVREVLCESASDVLRDAVMVTIEEHGHLPKGPKSEGAACDVANRIVAGWAPTKGSLLCACNRSWVPSETRTRRTADGKVHGYNDCE